MKKSLNEYSTEELKEALLAKESCRICSSEQALGHLQDIRSQDKEHFKVLHLDGANKVTHSEIVSIGTLNRALVHPREIFRSAIVNNCSSIMVAHNHPSGNLERSREDDDVTNRLKEAGQLLGIKLLDHIIVTDCQYMSYQEEGLL